MKQSESIIRKYSGEMIAMRKAGFTLRKIAEKYGVSGEYVRQITRGVEPPHANDSFLAVEMRKAGADTEQIAEALKVSINQARLLVRGAVDHQDIRTMQFWKKVDTSGDCWEWQGMKYPTGYGRFGWKGKVAYAHRVSWEITNGPIPDGMVIMHTCDNPSCVRPDHLQLGTQTENMKDRDRKGRFRMPEYHRGDSHPSSKMNSSTVLKMRSLYDRGLATPADLARSFGYKYNTVWSAVMRHSWKHLPSVMHPAQLPQEAR